MGGRLENLLDGKETHIPIAVLEGAKELFNVGWDYVKKVREGSPTLPETAATYLLLMDMLSMVKRMPQEEKNSELERLVIAMDVLTPDGKPVIIAKEHYRTLQDLFRVMHRGAGKYVPQFGQHSPYSVGTFDDEDD